MHEVQSVYVVYIVVVGDVEGNMDEKGRGQTKKDRKGKREPSFFAS